MLNRLHIENFRCLRRVSVSLRPLTVLIGPNDSGKTTFLDSICALLNRQTQFPVSDFWRHDDSDEILIRGTTGIGDTLTRSVEGGGSLLEQPNETAARALLLPVQRFQLPPAGVSMICSGYGSGDEESLPIGTDGSNVPALLDYLLRRDRKRFFDVEKALRDLIPGFESLDIATPAPERRQADFQIESGLKVSGPSVSSGVRLMLFFVALAFHPRPPRTILLEEPENGIHPKRLTDVVRLLRKVTSGYYNSRPVQILLTTHSPFVLDDVNLNEDQVLVFRRNEDGSRSTEPIDPERMKSFLDEFMLGEVWFNEEEAGLVAKP